MDCMYNSVFGPLNLLMVDLLMYSDLVYLVLVSLVCICLCFPVWTLKANWANISKNYRWLFICSLVIKYPPHFSVLEEDSQSISLHAFIVAIIMSIVLPWSLAVLSLHFIFSFLDIGVTSATDFWTSMMKSVHLTV